MPCWNFSKNSPKSIATKSCHRPLQPGLAVEAGARLGWDRWIGSKGDVICLDRFGGSAPARLPCATWIQSGERAEARARFVVSVRNLNGALIEVRILNCKVQPSAKGAKCNSLGHRPRTGGIKKEMLQALKARDKPCHLDHDHFNAIYPSREYFALSALLLLVTSHPGAVPQAIASRAVGAETRWANGSM